MKELEQCALPQECSALMDALRVSIADVMLEEILNQTAQMIATLEK